MSTTAKTSGLGWTTLSVDDASGVPEAIKNDVVSVQIGTPRAVWDVTGVDKSAIERVLLLADCSITLNTIFNPASTPSSHDVFSTVPSTSVMRTTTMTVAAKTLAPEILYTDYPLARSNSGELVAAVPGVLANGAVPTWS